ncbi:MAG: flavin reductase family protein [Coprobacillus sp.]|nr:flavin reductase family protein [Coprobacillus sp.]
MSFKEIKVDDFNFEGYDLFGKRWPLLGGGSPAKYNAMTISWGHYGSLWGHMGGEKTVVVYVRPTRYTREIIEENDIFTLSLLPSDKREALMYMGSHSGRDEDKIKNAGLTPCFEDNTMFIEEAEVVLICKKLYKDQIKEENFIDKSVIEEHYPKKDFHTVYIAEIVKAYVKE